MSEKETRFLKDLRVEPAAEGELPKLVGYAAKWNSFSHELPSPSGKFRELIRPGAFKRSLEQFPDVFAYVEHDSRDVIGRTLSGTLTLVEDEIGLRAEIEPAPTTAGKDVVISIGRGDIDGMSFMFNAIQDEWRSDDQGRIRELVECRLWEVSIVCCAAYPDASIAIRSMERWDQVQTELQERRKQIALRNMRYRLWLAEKTN